MPGRCSRASTASESWLAPASTITTASSVPTTTRSRSETSRWLLVGLMTTSPSISRRAPRRRVVEGDVGQHQRGRGAVDRQDVGIVLAVGGEHEGDDLGVVDVALGEERAQRAVDQAGGDDLLLGRPALALEEAAGDAAGGVGVLPVVDGQRQEVAGRRSVGIHAGGGQHHGVAVADRAGAVRLLGQVAGLAGSTSRCRSGLAFRCFIWSSSLFLSRLSAGAVAETSASRPRRSGRGRRAGGHAAPLAEGGAPGRGRVRLLADAEALDRGAVALEVLPLEVVEQAAAPADHLQQAATAVMILAVGLEVLGQLVDAAG